MKIIVKDKDSMYQTQHMIHGNYNGNDLYHGYQTEIKSIGYWDNKYHYGMFIRVYNPITGSASSRSIRWITINK